eukprot:gene7634-13415_t
MSGEPPAAPAAAEAAAAAAPTPSADATPPAAAGNGEAAAAAATHKQSQMHMDTTMPQVRSCRSLLGAGYVAGTLTDLQTNEQTRYVLPHRHRELVLDKNAVIQSFNHAFRGTDIGPIRDFDTDLFGYGNPLAPKFLTPMQGLTFDPQVFDGKVGRHLVGVLPQFNNLAR